MTRRARIEIVPADHPGHVGVDRACSSCPHFLRLRASNGRVLAHSETYANKANAKRAVKSWADAFADINGGDCVLTRRDVIEVDR